MAPLPPVDLSALPEQFGAAVTKIRSVVPAELASPQWGIIWYVSYPHRSHYPFKPF